MTLLPTNALFRFLLGLILKKMFVNEFDRPFIIAGIYISLSERPSHKLQRDIQSYLTLISRAKVRNVTRIISNEKYINHENIFQMPTLRRRAVPNLKKVLHFHVLRNKR